MTSSSSLRGYFSVGISTLFWGSLGFIVTTMKDKGFSPFDTAFLRLFFGFIILFIMICFSNREKFKIKKKDLLVCFVMGIIQGLLNLFYFSSIIKTGITTGVILLYTAPVFTVLFSRIVNQKKLTAGKVLSIIMAFTGCFLAVTGGGIQNFQGDLTGIILGILAGISYGALPLFNSKMVDKYHTDTILFYSFLSGFLVLLPFIQVPKILILFLEHRENIFIGVGLGFFLTVLPNIFFFKAFKYLDPVEVSIAANFEVVVAVFTAFMVYHEKLEGLKLLGIFFVMGAVILPNFLPSSDS